MNQFFRSLGLLALLLPAVASAQTTKTYSADNTTIYPNPERGMWLTRVPAWVGEVYSPLSKDDLIQNGRLKNRTLIHCRYVIDEYRSKDLDTKLLTQFRNDLAACREAGVKMVPLFMYNHGNIEGEGLDDAPQARVLRHLDQLGAAMQGNGDVLAYWGGGFVGRWGEWHNSSNNLWGNCIGDLSPGGKAILNKMFAVVPNNRAVVFRLTGYMQSMFGTQPLTASEAFTGSNKARAGFKNHYFMGIDNSAEGWCTITRKASGSCNWDCSEAAIVRERNYIHQQGSYAPVEAEPATNVNPATDPRHAGNLAVEQMKLQRISACNSTFTQAILNRWKADGVYDEIERSMGYRLQLVGATLPTQATAGNSVTVSFTIRNLGYAAPYNPRDVEVVLRRGSAVRRVKITADPRRWLPENGNISVTANVALPADLAAGAYELLLNLPDPLLPNRPEYSIRLANQNTWEAATGYNSFQHTLTVGEPVASTGTGLRYEYFTNRNLSSPAADTGLDPQVDFDWGTGSVAPAVPGLPADNFSVRWTGQVQAPVTGTYTFSTLSDDGVRLWVNGQQLVNNWTTHAPTENRGTISLTAGQKYDLKLEYYEQSGGAVCRLRWAYPGQAQQAIPQAQLFPVLPVAGRQAPGSAQSAAPADVAEPQPLAVYPNPGRGQFQVQLNAGAAAAARQLTVANAQGRVVRRLAPGPATAVEVDLRGEPAGLYLLRLTEGGKHSVTRLQVE